MNKQIVVYNTMEYFSLIKRNELSTHEQTCKKLKCVFLSGRSHSIRGLNCRFGLLIASGDLKETKFWGSGCPDLLLHSLVAIKGATQFFLLFSFFKTMHLLPLEVVFLESFCIGATESKFLHVPWWSRSASIDVSTEKTRTPKEMSKSQGRHDEGRKRCRYRSISNTVIIIVELTTLRFQGSQWRPRYCAE